MYSEHSKHSPILPYTLDHWHTFIWGHMVTKLSILWLKTHTIWDLYSPGLEAHWHLRPWLDCIVGWGHNSTWGPFLRRMVNGTTTSEAWIIQIKTHRHLRSWMEWGSSWWKTHRHLRSCQDENTHRHLRSDDQFYISHDTMSSEVWLINSSSFG